MTVLRTFPGSGLTEAPSPAEVDALCTAQAHAARALGRLDAALAWCPPEIPPILAARLVCETLISALRQEGHLFTDARFHAWFAGLATLSDEPLRAAHAPRALATTLLAEMARTPWTPLADVARALGGACQALRDDDSARTRETAQAALDEAAALVAALPPAPLPFAALAALHRTLSQSARFAPAERATETVRLDRLPFVIERPRPPSPRWAVEWAFGTYLRTTFTHGAMLPLNGLIRLDTVHAAESDENPVQAAIVQAEALHDALAHLNRLIDEAAGARAALAERYSARRSNSRARQLYGLLTGFGPLRSSQIEAVLGATRLGVRTVLAALAEQSDLAIETRSGVKLYSIAPTRPPEALIAPGTAPKRFPSEALADYDAALARLNAAMTRQDS